ncbi:histidine phosphatase family protein [Aquamicrobium sp.]|uniref:histidine phosphatase family protein n=1 Tax=Aquamicrobium sp. TaxID=1872579 RepID=UPI002583389D|nr:histidine phosphatase family protein [Aquamicrobium sp.]MCK9552661.1 histidine phosphatase family protein [Aquamicrobium sp.]
MLRYVILLLALLSPLPALATDAGWAALREGGHVVLLRHAMISGTTEPANFDIDKCNTQRNLSDRGRQQARKIGALFGARAARVERVESSRYCRALETARLAFGMQPEALEALDPLSDDAEARARQKEMILEQIRTYSGSDLLILVTHLENIQEITGVSPREGEVVIVAPQGDGVRVLGRVVF